VDRALSSVLWTLAAEDTIQVGLLEAWHRNRTTSIYSTSSMYQLPSSYQELVVASSLMRIEGGEHDREPPLIVTKNQEQPRCPAERQTKPSHDDVFSSSFLSQRRWQEQLAVHVCAHSEKMNRKAKTCRAGILLVRAESSRRSGETLVFNSPFRCVYLGLTASQPISHGIQEEGERVGAYFDHARGS
jgi:hypothetical protein